MTDYEDEYEDADEAIGVQLTEEIGNAIEAAVGQIEHGLVCRWVAIVETVDGEGRRGVWPVASDGCQAQDTLGLLHFALVAEEVSMYNIWRR